MELKTRFLSYGHGSFVTITNGSKELTVLLDNNLPVPNSLLDTAAELRGKASDLLARAALIESAAEHFRVEGKR